jgi:hypothetical protein
MTQVAGPPIQLLAQIETRLKQLDAEGWLGELTEIYRLSLVHGLALHESHPAIIVRGSGIGTTVTVAPFATVKFLGPRKYDFQPVSGQLPALFVNLHAPDTIILKQIELTLKAARKHFGPPVKKNGRYSLNHCFDENTFKVWRKNQIVQFGRLLAWRATLSAADAKSYPNNALGKILGLQSDRATSEVKAKLKKALASLPALLTQIADGTIEQSVAEQMIAASINKDI